MTQRRRWILWLVLDLLALAALFGVDWQLRTGGRASTVAATPTPTLSAAHYARRAEDAYRAGDLRSAEEGYRLALALEPENPARYPPLIRLLAFTNRLEEAAAWLERGRRLAPEDPRLLGMAALILDWQGKIPEAIQAGEQAVARLPGEAAFHAYLAEAYADAHRPQAALAAAQKALSLAPDSPDAHRALGYVYETLGRYAEAMAAYREALRRDPLMVVTWLALGRNALVLGQTATALDAFQRAAALRPEDPRVLDELGWLYYNLGRLEEAEQTLRRARERDPDDWRILYHLGVTLYARRKYEEVVDTNHLPRGIVRLQAVLQAEGKTCAPETLPTEPRCARLVEMAYLLGLSHYYLGDCAAARPWLEQALAISPQEENARRGLRWCEGQSPTP